MWLQKVHSNLAQIRSNTIGDTANLNDCAGRCSFFVFLNPAHRSPERSPVDILGRDRPGVWHRAVAPGRPRATWGGLGAEVGAGQDPVHDGAAPLPVRARRRRHTPQDPADGLAASRRRRGGGPPPHRGLLSSRRRIRLAVIFKKQVHSTPPPNSPSFRWSGRKCVYHRFSSCLSDSLLCFSAKGT